MSNKKNTPELDKTAVNFYITPIKKKRINFTNENYTNNENLAAEIYSNINQNPNLNSNYKYDQNEFYNKSNKNSNSSNKTTENKKNFISSTYKKCFKSPFSNFLLHSPASFENYFNCFSRKKINVLNLIDKNKCELNKQKEKSSLNIMNNDLNFKNNFNLENSTNNNELDCNAYLLNSFDGNYNSNSNNNDKQIEILRTPVNNNKNRKRKILKQQINSEVIYSSDKSNFVFALTFSFALGFYLINKIK